MRRLGPSRVRRLLHGGRPGDAADASAGRITGTLAIQLAGRALTLPLSFLGVALLARSLDPAGFGVWTAALAYVTLWSTVTDVGLTTAATLRMAAHPDQEAAWLGALCGLRAVLSVATTIVAAATVPLFIGGDAVRGTALVLSATILTTGANALSTVFSSRLRVGLSVTLSVGQSALWTVAVAGVDLAGGRVVDFAWAFLAVQAAFALAQLVAVRRFARIGWREGRRLWGELMRVAIPLGLASVLIVVYYRVDALLLYAIGGAREAGIYGAAYRFLDPLTTLPAIVMSAFFPVLAAVYGRDRMRAQRLVQACAVLMAALSLPALGITLVLSPQIVGLLYGAGFGRAAGVLPILMGAFVSICFGSLAGYLAPVLDLQWRLALFSAVGAVANVVLNLVLIGPYGARGSAWATLVTEVLTMLLLLTTALRRLELRLDARRLALVVVAAALTTGAMAAARPAGLVPALLAGLVVYGAALPALRVVRPSELRGLRSERGAP